MIPRAQTTRHRPQARACALLLLPLAAFCPAAARAFEGGARRDPAPATRGAQSRPAADAEDGFARRVAEGYALVAAGRFAEAAALFRALVAERPGDPSALYGAALAFFNAGRAAEAEPLAQRAADGWLAAPRGAAGAAGPGAADAFVLLAVIQSVRGDDGAALRSARRAAGLAPENFDAQFTLGRALYGAGDDAGAVAAFRAALALRPEESRALFFLATTLERAGDEAGALAAYREMASRRPREAEGHLGLGVLLVKRGGGGDAEEGLKELARALEINPDLYEARVTLGRALVARGRAAEAVEHLRRAAALAPDNPEPHYQLSVAYRRLGRKEEAAAESAVVRRIHESRRAGNVNVNVNTNKPPAAPGAPRD
jgi:Flp pilus assembly protein TadD